MKTLTESLDALVASIAETPDERLLMIYSAVVMARQCPDPAYSAELTIFDTDGTRLHDVEAKVLALYEYFRGAPPVVNEALEACAKAELCRRGVVAEPSYHVAPVGGGYATH